MPQLDLNSLGLDPIRAGRVTASAFYKLVGTPRSKSAIFTDTALTYLNARLAERLTGLPEPAGYVSEDMQRGLDLESEALFELSVREAVALERVGFQRYGDLFGCTPDAKVIGYNVGAEVKCPTSAVMIEYLKCKSASDLRDNFPAAFWQVQASLFFTGWESWLFAAYDPRFVGERRLASLTVTPDPEAFDIIESKIKLITNYFEQWKSN